MIEDLNSEAYIESQLQNSLDWDTYVKLLIWIILMAILVTIFFTPLTWSLIMPIGRRVARLMDIPQNLSDIPAILNNTLLFSYYGPEPFAEALAQQLPVLSETPWVQKLNASQPDLNNTPSTSSVSPLVYLSSWLNTTPSIQQVVSQVPQPSEDPFVVNSVSLRKLAMKIEQQVDTWEKSLEQTHWIARISGGTSVAAAVIVLIFVIICAPKIYALKKQYAKKIPLLPGPPGPRGPAGPAGSCPSLDTSEFVSRAEIPTLFQHFPLLQFYNWLRQGEPPAPRPLNEVDPQDPHRKAELYLNERDPPKVETSKPPQQPVHPKLHIKPSKIRTNPYGSSPALPQGQAWGASEQTSKSNSSLLQSLLLDPPYPPGINECPCYNTPRGHIYMIGSFNTPGIQTIRQLQKESDARVTRRGPYPLDEQRPFPRTSQEIGMAAGMQIFGVDIVPDTGSSVSYVTEKLAIRMGAYPVAIDPNRVGPVTTATGNFVRFRSFIRGLFVVGGMTYSHLFMVQPRGLRMSNTAPFDLLMGNDLISKIGEMTIDYRNGKVIFRDAATKLRCSFDFNNRIDDILISTGGRFKTWAVGLEPGFPPVDLVATTAEDIHEVDVWRKAKREDRSRMVKNAFDRIEAAYKEIRLRDPSATPSPVRPRPLNHPVPRYPSSQASSQNTVADQNNTVNQTADQSSPQHGPNHQTSAVIHPNSSLGSTPTPTSRPLGEPQFASTPAEISKRRTRNQVPPGGRPPSQFPLPARGAARGSTRGAPRGMPRGQFRGTNRGTVAGRGMRGRGAASANNLPRSQPNPAVRDIPDTISTASDTGPVNPANSVSLHQMNYNPEESARYTYGDDGILEINCTDYTRGSILYQHNLGANYDEYYDMENPMEWDNNESYTDMDYTDASTPFDPAEDERYYADELNY